MKETVGFLMVLGISSSQLGGSSRVSKCWSDGPSIYKPFKKHLEGVPNHPMFTGTFQRSPWLWKPHTTAWKTAVAIVNFHQLETPYIKQQSSCLKKWYLAILLVTFLGWWVHVTLLSVKWPPTFGDQKVTWATEKKNFLLSIIVIGL